MVTKAATMTAQHYDVGHLRTDSQLAPRAHRGANAVGKRLFDIVAATLLFVVALPAMIILAVAVAASLRTWRPLFFQQRIGRDGRPFTFVKLRTLPTATPRYADKYAIATVTTTRLGRFLRASHLDELPQLALVVTGRMSLVGPRPEMAGLLERFPAPFVAARLSVRPGCTGIWQISGDADRLIGEAPHYDLYYLAHANARLDLWILGRTLLRVAGRAGRVFAAPAWTRAHARPPPAPRHGPNTELRVSLASSIRHPLGSRSSVRTTKVVQSSPGPTRKPGSPAMKSATIAADADVARLSALLGDLEQAALCEGPCRGHELAQAMGDWQRCNPGQLDGLRRRMEATGLGDSEWELSGAEPSRRTYSLIPSGEDAVRECFVGLAHLGATLDPLHAALCGHGRAPSYLGYCQAIVMEPDTGDRGDTAANPGVGPAVRQVDGRETRRRGVRRHFEALVAKRSSRRRFGSWNPISPSGMAWWFMPIPWSARNGWGGDEIYWR